MTKYILNSGGLKNKPERAEKYFSELFQDLGDTPTLLWCFFASLPDDSRVRFEKYTQLFKKYFPEGIQPLNISATVENFSSEVQTADAIYFHGGSVEPLKEILSQFDYKDLFDGKVIGCNSASSMVFASYYWSCDGRFTGEGLSLFPIKYLAHFNSNYGAEDPRGPIDWQKAYSKLEATGEKHLPIYALEEGEFVTFQV